MQEIKRTGAIKRDSCANFLARFEFGREGTAFLLRNALFEVIRDSRFDI